MTLTVSDHITDAGLEHLRGLTKLRFLNISGNAITDQAFKVLGTMPNITTLYVGDNNKITGEELAQLRSLATLDLTRTAVSDQTLPQLYGLKSLFFLKLKGTKVTAVGIAALQKALPNCTIEWDRAAKTTMPQPAASGTK